MAWSRNALNLISALQSTSGFGVRPAEYSRRNSANTRSLYSAAKLTASTSMPIKSATETTSIQSCRVEQYSLSSSSSQFFMKRPTTSYPCSLRSHAVTDESTPPDMPTTTRCLLMDSLNVQLGPDRMRMHEVERETPAREVIVDALHDERRAVALARGAQLVGGQPQRADDVGIERAIRQRLAARSAEREAQIGGAIAVGPSEVRHVYADQCVRRERMRRFLQRFAYDGLNKRFTGLQMTGRLVDAQAVGGVLLDHEKTSVALDDRRHRHMRDPGFRFHRRAFYRLPAQAAGAAPTCQLSGLDQISVLAQFRLK